LYYFSNRVSYKWFLLFWMFFFLPIFTTIYACYISNIIPALHLSSMVGECLGNSRNICCNQLCSLHFAPTNQTYLVSCLLYATCLFWCIENICIYIFMTAHCPNLPNVLSAVLPWCSLYYLFFHHIQRRRISYVATFALELSPLCRHKLNLIEQSNY